MTVLFDLGRQNPTHCKVGHNSCAALPSKPAIKISGGQSCGRQAKSGKYLLAAESSGLTSSVQLGPSADEGQRRGTQNGAVSIEGVELKSEAGQDYTALRDALQSGHFQAADDETRALLIRLAGPEAEKRDWVYFTEVKFIPEADLQTIDQLWRAASSNKFGYSAQKETWLQNRKRWDKFFQKIDWVQGKNNNYRKWPKEFTYSKEAPKGHLPLTNCLRGTQLFKAIMEHPAFNKSGSNPEWLG